MTLTKEKKTGLIGAYRLHGKDTGSPEVQIAILSERIGYGKTAALGLALAGIGFAAIWQTWTLEVADGVVAVEMALVGIGLGLTFSPISASVINAADRDKLGVASALVIIMRLLGMTISISLLTAFASQRLATLAAAELGQQVVDPFAALDIYARLTIHVLTEIALLGVIICAVGLIPALLLPVAVVYCQMHYAVDALSGLLVGLVAGWVGIKSEGRTG